MEEVFQQWNKASYDRKLRAPWPIPVRWQWSRRGVASPMAAALGDAESPAPFPPLPGVPPADARTLTAGGGIKDLFRLYGGLPSGRIALLGRPGSGKSETALLTLVEALRHRRGIRNPAERAAVPVPVLLSVTGWDASRDELADWAAARIAEDHRTLRQQRQYGRRAAEKLVYGGRVALFLDGFDELEPALRQAALREIGQHAVSRVVVFARTEEFAETIRAGHLPGATVLELAPIPGAVAARYLRHYQVEPAPEPWQRLMDHLERRPDSVVSRALDVPLGLTLVRDAFPEPEALDDLLDEDRFATPDDVMTYLLDRFISIAYQPRQPSGPVAYDAAQARRWLSYLAGKMREHDTYSLDWRQLPRWERAFPRIGMLGAVCTVTAAFGGALVYGWGGFNTHQIRGAGAGSLVGAATGLVLGLAAGTASELRAFRPEGLGWRFPRSRRRRRLGFNPGVALIVGLVIGIVSADYVLNVTHQAAASLAVLLGVGTGAGAIAGVSAMRVHPAPVRAGRLTWRAVYSRLPLLPGAAAGGLPVGFRYLFPHGVAQDAHPLGGPLNGLWGMLMVSLIIGAARLPSQAGIHSDPYAIWKQELRWDVVFGTLFGLCVGLGFGLRESLMWEKDVVAGIVQTIGIAVPCAICVMSASSEAGRSTLLFLQLHIQGEFPARGMNFLEDAYHRQVLRAEGPRYQFRHALLQDKLSY
ncbi:NACHT domain-containing protein [Kitasatospora sp. NPDC101183]|uniref:NACHT domain-containing protein n=1 Tax=Kitasatospora sp. NPDC101183 TaxID=3364100 RepID=UPI003824207A